MVSALATVAVVGAVTRPVREGSEKMSNDGPTTIDKVVRRKDARRSGTKRFPRGRLVSVMEGTGRGINSLRVVVGSVRLKGKPTLIATSKGLDSGSGSRKTAQLFRSGEISPVVIRKSVLGMKGGGSIKPRVKGPLSGVKIKSLRVTTQKQLDRAGG